MAKEVRRSAIMSQVLDRLTGSRQPDERTALAELLSSVSCGRLWSGGDSTPQALAERWLLPVFGQARQSKTR